MKRVLLLVLAAVAILGLAACGKEEKVLNVYFVPSRDGADILDTVAPLEELLKAELASLGFEYDSVKVSVGSSYEVAAQAVTAGNAEVVFLPGGTYVTYENEGEGLVPILAATRSALTVSGTDPLVWNQHVADNGKIDGDPDSVATGYASILVVNNTTTIGAALLAELNGSGLTWDTFKDVNFCRGSATSSAGTIYPGIWVNDVFGKTLDDLTNVLEVKDYGQKVADLKAGNCDVVSLYGDARRDYEANWDANDATKIWTETSVIGVTDMITNDGIQVGGHVSAELRVALATAFKNLIETDEGAAIFAIYSHTGYADITAKDYNGARKASGFDPID